MSKAAPSHFQSRYRALEAAMQAGRGEWESGRALLRRMFLSEPLPVAAEAGVPGRGSALLGDLNRDAIFGERESFPVWVLSPGASSSPDGRHTSAVVLLHGLNERRWTKYLPWAEALCRELGRPVVLFPMAFHMERAPQRWSDPREMRRVSLARMQAMPSLSDSTYVNAALSVRLHAQPVRLLWSGYRTLLDLRRWARHVDGGGEPLLEPGARLDFFGYSIGAFLAEILLMGDVERRFERSRVFSFCGGCLLGQSSPAAREILDSAAARALHRLFVDEWEWEKAVQPGVAELLAEDPCGRAFEMMLCDARLAGERQRHLEAIGERIRAVALRQDAIIPAEAVQRTLEDTGATVETLDLPYEYDHVHPFPLRASDGAEVDRAFEQIFSRAARWLER